MTTTDPHTLVGPYVLDALPFDEHNIFEDHLDGCPDCRVDVDELRATAARLGRATAVVPPPALRQRVLDEVARTRQMPPGPATGSAARLRRGWVPPLAVAAMLIVVALLGTLAVRANQRANDAEQIASVVAAPDAQTIQVEGDPELTPESMTMRVVASDDEDASVVIAEGMDAAPAGKAYTLWFQRGEVMVFQDLLEPDENGNVEQEIDGVPTTVVGVTVEDEGADISEPTPPIIAAGEV